MFDYKQLSPLENPDQIFSLEGRTALLFGGAGKMGEQFAQTLGLAGANIVITDIDENLCNRVVEKLDSKFRIPILGVKCDATKEDEIGSTISSTVSRFGALDILIYNVMAKPVGYYAPFEQYTEQTWNDVVAGNLTGAFLSCREALAPLKLSQNASIILTSSTYGIVGPDHSIYRGLTNKSNLYDQEFPLNTPLSYSASKAGLIGVVRHMATLFGKHGIRVNALTPGGVYDKHEVIFEERYSRRTALRRMATWSDYNGAILFLASDASRYMTGANLVIDGGWTAQ